MGSQRLAANSPTRLKYFVLAKLLAKMATDIRLGSYRNTMLQNPLLRKAELGKPMQRGFELPGEEFIYGRPNHCIDGGAQEAMQYMVLQRQREKRDIKARQAKTKELTARKGKNFLKFNKLAIQSGLVTAAEQAQASEEIVKQSYQSAQCTKVDPQKVARRRCPPDMTFGISTRPSTPVFELLEHRYQTRWLQGQAKKQTQSEECNKNGAQGIYQTQTKVLRACREQSNRRTASKFADESTQQLWQMPKWKRVPAHLDTFRSREVKECSFKAHEASRHTKRGKIGHGICFE